MPHDAALAKLPDGVAAPSLAAQQAIAPAPSDQARKLFEQLEAKPLPSAPAAEAKPRASLVQPSAPAVATPPAPAAAAPSSSSSAAARPTLNAAAATKGDGPSPLVIVGALGVLGAGAAIASNSNSAEGAAAAAAPAPPAAAAPAAPPADDSSSGSAGPQ